MDAMTPSLPSPATPLSSTKSPRTSRSSFSFFGETPPTPRTPGAAAGTSGGRKSSRRSSQTSELQYNNGQPATPSSKLKRKSSVRKKQLDMETIEAMENEAERIRFADASKITFKDFYPEDYTLEEGDERRYLDSRSAQENLVLQDVLATLQNWVNDVLGDDTRVRVTNMTDDFHDGYVLKVLFEKLSGDLELRMPLDELVQSEERKKLNLSTVLDQIHYHMKLPKDKDKWTLESIFEKNLLSNLHILIAFVNHFTPKGKVALDLPNSLKVKVVTVAKKNGQFVYEMITQHLIEGGSKKDGFDMLIDNSPEKIHYVKQSLIQFSNKHLSKIRRSVKDVQDFADGVDLILIIGLLKGFYVPLYEYFPKPEKYEDKLHNVSLAFRFLDEMEVPRRNQPADVVRGDLKAIMRIIYALFVLFPPLKS